MNCYSQVTGPGHRVEDLEYINDALYSYAKAIHSVEEPIAFIYSHLYPKPASHLYPLPAQPGFYLVVNVGGGITEVSLVDFASSAASIFCPCFARANLPLSEPCNTGTRYRCVLWGLRF